MAPKVAIVTGSNKGIGLATVRALCKSFQGDVFLTSRNTERGQDAVKLLEKEDLHPKFHQLDIDDYENVNAFRDYFKATYGGIDVLVNNAGIAFKQSSTAPFDEQAQVTLRTNYFSTVNLIKTLLPLINEDGRILSVSSFVAIYTLKKCSEERKRQLKDPNITEDQLNKIINEFIEAAQQGKIGESGFPEMAYGMSKVVLTVWTKIFAKEVKKCGKKGVLLNCCDPGWVKTDMAGDKATKTPDQGAESSFYLSMIQKGATEPQGEHVDDKNKVVDWQNDD